MKKYRVVRMVVQVQATITQRRGGPTTLVTGDACSIQENNNKPTATPPSISRFLAAMNHSHHLKRVTLFCCSSRLQLSANLYSVDWLDGQSTCPIYANERISWSAFMSHNKALTYESNQSRDFVNYCSLVFSIFSEAWDGFTPQSSIFTQCLTRQEVQNKWSRSWAYFSLFLSSRLKFIVSRATNSRQEKNPTSYKYSWPIIFHSGNSDYVLRPNTGVNERVLTCTVLTKGQFQKGWSLL